MIKIIRGAARSGKSEYVLKEIKKRCQNGKRSVLLVPEQTNFFYEKKIATTITSASDLVEVVSFSIFAKRYAPEYKDVSDIQKRIYMHLALNNANLNVYKRHYKTADFIEKMLKVYEETTSAGIDLLSFAQNEKYYELGKIIEEYKRLSDIKDVLLSAIEKLENIEETAFFIDDFSGFSKSQIEFIKALSQKSESVTMCLIGNFGDFSYIDKTAKSLEPYELITLNVKEKPSAKKYCFRPATTLTESFAVANLIYDLVKDDGYRYKDIVVVAGEDERLKKIKHSLSEYKIPAFFDVRDDSDSAMFFQGLKSALSLAANLRTASIESLYKNPFSGLTEDESYELENYSYIWSLKYSDFKTAFYKNPSGYLKNENDEKSLAHLEEIRQKLMTPLLKLSDDLKQRKGKIIAKGIYDYLEKIKVKETFTQKFKGDFLLRQSQYYSSLCDVLDIIYALDDSIELPPKEVVKLIDVALSSLTSALPPRHNDEVTCGIMNRMRIDEAKVVILVSAIKGVFPCYQEPIGLLNNSDRLALNLSDNKEFAEKEKVFVYAVTKSPSERLYVMCPNTELSGKKLIPSEFFTKENLVTLDESFKEELTNKKINHNLSDSKVIEEMFGKTMSLSSSKFERFYDCPFSYFVNYGLNIKKIEKAELSAANRGTLLHYVLEKIVPIIDKCDLRTKIDEIIGEYTKTYSLTIREKARYERLASWLYLLLTRLKEDLKKDGYKPVRFELNIDRKSEVEPIILKTEKGTEIFVRGKVDRVDIKNENDTKYLRIIDYKTGGKDFSTFGVYNGINLQMLIYLFAILNNGKGELSNCTPSAVLYQPILGDFASDERNVNKNYEAKGINFKDQKQIDDFKNVVNARLTEMAEKLENGFIASLPFVNKKHDPCKFCDYKYICGFKNGDPTRIPYSETGNDGQTD